MAEQQFQPVLELLRLVSQTLASVVPQLEAPTTEPVLLHSIPVLQPE